MELKVARNAINSVRFGGKYYNLRSQLIDLFTIMFVCVLKVVASDAR
jgi:hypothetical protein